MHSYSYVDKNAIHIKILPLALGELLYKYMQLQLLLDKISFFVAKIAMHFTLTFWTLGRSIIWWGFCWNPGFNSH